MLSLAQINKELKHVFGQGVQGEIHKLKLARRFENVTLTKHT